MRGRVRTRPAARSPSRHLRRRRQVGVGRDPRATAEVVLGRRTGIRRTVDHGEEVEPGGIGGVGRRPDRESAPADTLSPPRAGSSRAGPGGRSRPATGPGGAVSRARRTGVVRRLSGDPVLQPGQATVALEVAVALAHPLVDLDGAPDPAGLVRGRWVHCQSTSSSLVPNISSIGPVTGFFGRPTARGERGDGRCRPGCRASGRRWTRSRGS